MTVRNNNKETTESPIFSSLPIKDIEFAYNESLYVWNNDGSVSQFIQFSGMNDSALGEDSFNKIYSSISSVISRLNSDRVTIGFHLVRNSKIEIPKIPKNMPILVKERVGFLEKVVKNKEIFSNSFYISINSRPTYVNLSMREKLKSSFESIKSAITGKEDEIKLEASYKEVKSRLKEVSQYVISIRTLLQKLGVKSHVLETKDEIFSLYRSLFAPQKSLIQDLKISNEKSSIRRELFSGVACEEKRDYFILDDYFHQTFELDRIPSKAEVKSNAVSFLVNAPFECIYTVLFRVLNHKETNKNFQDIIKKADREMEMAKDSQGKVNDFTLIEDYSRFVDAYKYLASEGACAVEYSCNFTYRQKLQDIYAYCRENAYEINDFVLENKEYLYQNIFANLAQSEWIAPPKGHWETFCAFMPGMASIKSGRIKTLIDLPFALSHLLPCFGSDRDDIKHYGINHLFSDNMSLKKFDIFDPTLPSWNKIVTGDMGSGKSVFSNVLISSAMSSLMVSGKKPLIRILDYGGATSSYFKLLRIMGGENINFSKSSQRSYQIMDIDPRYSLPNGPKMKDLISKLVASSKNLTSTEALDCLNLYYERVITEEIYPNSEQKKKIFKEAFKEKSDGFESVKDDLELKEGECTPNMTDMRSIISKLEIMLSNDPNNLEAFRTTFNRDDVQTFVTNTYNNTLDRNPRISDLLDLIVNYNKKKNHPIINTMIQRLTKWSAKGQYKMFDRDTDINLTNDFVMFDLFGLDDDPHLKAIWTSVIIDVIRKDMFTKMDRMRLCVLDEAWSALSTPSLRKEVISFSRLSRKYKFSVVLATQLPTDFFLADPEDGKTIVSQATEYIFCGITDPSVIKDTARLYNLDEQWASELDNLGVKTRGGIKSAPVYSRILHVAKSKDGRRVQTYKNFLSPFEYQAFSSSKEDNAIIRFYLDKRNMDVVDAINYLIDKKHIGDPELIQYLKEGNHTEAVIMVGGKL